MSCLKGSVPARLLPIHFPLQNVNMAEVFQEASDCVRSQNSRVRLLQSLHRFRQSVSFLLRMLRGDFLKSFQNDGIKALIFQ